MGIYKPKDEFEAQCIQALKVSIEYGSVSASYIQRQVGLGYQGAMRVVDWMIENGFITSCPTDRFEITKEQFQNLFGDDDVFTVESAGSAYEQIRENFGVEQAADEEEIKEKKSYVKEDVADAINQIELNEYTIEGADGTAFRFSYEETDENVVISAIVLMSGDDTAENIAIVKEVASSYPLVEYDGGRVIKVRTSHKGTLEGILNLYGVFITVYCRIYE